METPSTPTPSTPTPSTPTPSTPTPSQTKKANPIAARTKRAKDTVMRKIESGKVKEVSYIEFVNENTSAWPPPSHPPWTTWSGLMECAPDSPYAKRLIQNCGGVPIAVNGTECEEGATAFAGFWKAQQALAAARAAARAAEKTAAAAVAEAVAHAENDLKTARTQLTAKGVAAVVGFWTAPQDWQEMLTEMQL